MGGDVRCGPRLADPSNYVISLTTVTRLTRQGATRTTGLRQQPDWTGRAGRPLEPEFAGDHAAPGPVPGEAADVLLCFQSGLRAADDSSGHPLTDGTSATQMIAADGFDGDVGVYVEGCRPTRTSLTYELVGSGGDVVASTSVHMAIVDISLVDVNGNALSSLSYCEDLPTMLSELSPDVDYDLYGSLQLDEYKTNIEGLHSDQIQQVTVTSDAGDEYQDALTDTAGGAVRTSLR